MNSQKKTAAKTHHSPLITNHSVLTRPRITEKSAQATARGVYTFEVSMRSTKSGIKEAVRTLYGVTPVKINIVKTAGKRVRMRTRRGYGTKSAVKKAYVYLKKGDKIEFAS